MTPEQEAAMQIKMKYGVVKTGTVTGLIEETNKLIAEHPDEIELTGGICYDGNHYLQAYTIISF